jgi:uncharacterized OB-fold protein
MAVQVPVDEGLFTWPSDEPRLLGSRCGCGVVAFPAQGSCPRDGGETTIVELPRRGTLWTFTTQGFAPKGPPDGPFLGSYEPYAVGYVELADHCKVESRLTESDPSKLSVGMEMELVILPFRTDEQGNEVLTFAFQPVEAN